MLEEKGHQVELYDKFYAQDHSVFDKEFDFITLTEVIEHLEILCLRLERLTSILKPKGVLAIMTQTLTKETILRRGITKMILHILASFIKNH